MADILAKTSTALPLFYRTYSRRKPDGLRESWDEMVDRVMSGTIELGKLNDRESELVRSGQENLTALVSGRWQWVGGTEWVTKSQNFSGAYNCSAFEVTDWYTFAFLMDLTMQGCGTGSLLEHRCIEQLPPIINKLNITVNNQPGDYAQRWDDTSLLEHWSGTIKIEVGDSRQGWTDAYLAILNLASDPRKAREIKVEIDLGGIRANGERINGFGGVTNSFGLRNLFDRMGVILTGSIGRNLTSVECCLLLDEASKVVVAGNIRRSASIHQFDASDKLAAVAKDNLWQERDGKWTIDPDRDALRMGNHTRVFHHKPTFDECLASVIKQYYSGEGAIQWAGEAIARANADILDSKATRDRFLTAYEIDRASGREYLASQLDSAPAIELDHRMGRYLLNPCFAAGTTIVTRAGHFPIETLVGKIVEIWDGDEWVTIDNFRVTGENQPVFSVNLQNGQSIVATEYHSFVLESGDRKMLSELLPGDRLLTHTAIVDSGADVDGAYLKGFLIGDGTNAQGYAKLSLYPPKYICEDRLISSAVEIQARVLATRYNTRPQSHAIGWGFTEESYGRKNMQGLAQVDLLYWGKNAKAEYPVDTLNWSLKSKAEFIAGVLDSDGCAVETIRGFGYQLTSIHKHWLIVFQLLLKTIGIDAKISPVRRGGLIDFGRGGVYQCKDNYRLAIAQIGSIKLSQICKFSRLKTFADKTTKYQLKSRWNKIESIEFSHVADKVYCCTVPTNHQVSLSNGITVGQCAEIIGNNFMCNLSEVHLNNLDPSNFTAQNDAFTAAGISAAALLHHQFTDAKQKYSRELDPIVGVSFTGLFDFFVHAFGVDWLRWWEAGRSPYWDDCQPGTINAIAELLPSRWLGGDKTLETDADWFSSAERYYLRTWRNMAETAVYDYCTIHNLKLPNRCTTVQPAGSKSLLSGASPGWHPPKSQRFIRRMTFRKKDPVALACIEYGYSVIPSQSDKDEHGNLLTDPFDERCTEWLVEMPIAVSWADIPGVENIEISKFSALAQMDFYMQVQTHYTTHNTSATIELREEEIEPLAIRIHQAISTDEGYISVALLARFDDRQTFPRMPFEPIDLATYNQLVDEMLARRQLFGLDRLDREASGEEGQFQQILAQYDRGVDISSGPIGCDGDKCLI
jgi:ribonucleotide reductase class II